MKKTIIIIIVALVLIAAVALGLVWYFVWNDSAYIGRDAAKAAALADAGFSAQEVQRLKADFERDDGFVFYEVKFISGTTEYEYTIDASTGAVLHSERSRCSTERGAHSARSTRAEFSSANWRL